MRCRDYSVKFSTPLHIVVDLDPMFVLQALYESQYPPSIVEEELEELLDILNKIKDPSYKRVSQQDTEDLVDAVLNKELARAAKKKSPTQESIRSEIIANQAKPKSGSMNFGELEKLESQSEANKSGFKD